MKQDIENIINENLPEKKEDDGFAQDPSVAFNNGFDEALSQINTSFIADEVLRVVGEKIKEEFGKTYQWYDYDGLLNKCCMSKDIEQLLSNLSNNEENKDNG